MSGEPMWHAPDGSVWLWSVERGDWSGMDPSKYGLNAAISDWLSAATGLPVDFQFQGEPEWTSHDGEPRIPVGLSRG